MQFLVYEFVTGGGTWSTPDVLSPEGSLLREGHAMVSALVEDLCQFPNADVLVLRDSRLRDLAIPAHRVFEIADADAEIIALLEIGSRVDGVILIAPELNGILRERCELIENAGGRLLSPSSEVVALCSDKHRTALWLAERGIRVPAGQLLTNSEQTYEMGRFPAIAKPVDGCGSLNVRLVQNADGLQEIRKSTRSAWRVEEFCPGLAASVAVLCGPFAKFPLPAARQCLATDGSFSYLGGELPLSAALNDRAQRLALQAVNSLPNPVGYVGVDMVLGDTTNGTEDVAIEINPRLTTSYVGLRRITQGNLAVAMVAVALGEKYELSFHPNRLEFNSDGTTRWL